MKFNPAALFYCLSALKYYENLTEEEIRDIGFEISLIGQNGIDFNNPDSRYYIKSLNKKLSGLQALSYMYVAWKRINATMDVGIDFQEEYLMAKRLFEKEQSKSDILEDHTKSYILSFSELGVNKAMSDDEILLRVVQFGGFKTPRAVTIDVMREVEIVLVNSIEFLQELSDIDKESFQQAINNAQNGKIQLALNQFKKLLTKYPKKTSILENIGRCYLELKEWNDAKLHYGFALECEKTEYGYIGLANSYMRLGDINKAIQYYEEAIVLNPASALAYNNLAAAMMEVNRPKDAEKNFFKALDLEPDNPQTLLGIGLMYKEAGDFEKARDYIKKAERNSDKAPHLKIAIAETHNQLTNPGNIVLNRAPKNHNTNSEIPDLCDDVKRILIKAESISSKGFKFLSTENLTEYAGIKIARKSDNKHIIYYKKERSDLLQHLIAHECGHVIRIFSAKETDRVVPATSNETKEIAFTEMKDDIIRLSNQFPERELSIIMNMYYNGVVRQATNQPVDYLIEKWLYDEYPGLHNYQFLSLQKQAEESIEALSDEVRRITPPLIYHASNLMNYAYLRLVGFHIHTNFVKPYGNSEFVNPGKSLAERTKREQEDSFLGDIKMINIWSETVGISKWFEWVDFEKSK